jgi:hypothetical protein
MSRTMAIATVACLSFRLLSTKLSGALNVGLTRIRSVNTLTGVGPQTLQRGDV